MTGDGSDDILLTKAVRAQLRAELMRTGVTASVLLGNASQMPEGLTPRTVHSWMRGVVRSAARDQFTAVIAALAELPDGGSRKPGPRYPTATGLYVELSEAMVVQLRTEMRRTGVEHTKPLDGARDIPARLNTRIVTGWLYRRIKTVKVSHWTFVMDHLAAMPDSTVPLTPIRNPRGSGVAAE